MRQSLFFVLALALTAAGSSGLAARASSNDGATITALYKQFGVAFEHKDLNRIMSFYVPGDSLFVFDVGPPREHRGWNDYREGRPSQDEREMADSPRARLDPR